MASTPPSPRSPTFDSCTMFVLHLDQQGRCPLDGEGELCHRRARSTSRRPVEAFRCDAVLGGPSCALTIARAGCYRVGSPMRWPPTTDFPLAELWTEIERLADDEAR